MKKNHLFSFFVIFAADIEHYHNFMKRILKYVLIIAVFAITSLATTGCFRQDLLMFEDGEFDGVEFSDYDVLHNAELDMDDTERD